MLSTETPELNAALAKAQGAFPTIARSVTVSAGTFSYNYAPLDAVVAAVRPILAENGLSVVQLLGPGPSLRTELRHASGEAIGSSFPFEAPADPKKLGSLLTYLRRYSLVAILGLATEEDDDASAAGDSSASSSSSSDRGAGESGSSSGPKITDAQNRKIAVLLKELEEKQPTREGQKPYVQEVRELVGVRSRKDMTKAQASRVIEWLEGQMQAVDIPL